MLSSKLCIKWVL